MFERLELSGGRFAEALPPEQQTQYSKDFTGNVSKIFRINPCGTIVPEGIKYYEEDIYNFKFRPDDVLVMSYPKCGTTWLQEIIWNMRNNPDLDHQNPEEPLLARSPVIETDMALHDYMLTTSVEKYLDEPMFSTFKTRCPNLDPKRGIHLQMAESLTEPRTLKTHLPPSCFQPGLINKCKVVLIVRHPKDVVLSFQHHCRLLKSHGFTGSQDVFIEYFVNDLMIYGSYGNLVREALQFKLHPNFYLLFYEDLKADIQAELRKLNVFLGTGLSELQLQNVERQTCFKNMQKFDPYRVMSSAVSNMDVAQKDGPFIRRGLAMAWKGELTEEQEKMMNDFIMKHFTDQEFKARFH
ncbi:sulfotransferase 1A1 [Hyalella azteca]|uniref:Sulfotransferase 1A1 n=1 Tax=Hyalella azteca TaxID=294128 RepID=A0A8B7PAG9_HYAAZ|nr:sulfotransferase 1A1 [Hyalella azteca]XP_018022976.1 sulfotransferase 1A1 [Hyalella azteca]